jgi:hypothetical protein
MSRICHRSTPLARAQNKVSEVGLRLHHRLCIHYIKLLAQAPPFLRPKFRFATHRRPAKASTWIEAGSLWILGLGFDPRSISSRYLNEISPGSLIASLFTGPFVSPLPELSVEKQWLQKSIIRGGIRNRDRCRRESELGWMSSLIPLAIRPGMMLWLEIFKSHVTHVQLKVL